MKTAAIVCNAVLFAVTGFIILTEGVPRDARHLALTLLMLLVPLLTAVVFLRERVPPQGPTADDRGSSTITLAKRAAVLCNVALFAASCWAVVVQYPYPEGNSVIPFAALTLWTPILSLMALRGGGRRAMQEERRGAAGGE
jgi:hypothetical protein